MLETTLYDGEDKAPVDDEHPLAPPKQQLAQIVVTDNSPLVRRTLNQAGFSYRYELTPLALHRSRRQRRPNDTPIVRRGAARRATCVLVQGKDEEIARLKDSGELLVLDATTDLPHTQKAPLAFALMLLIVAARGDQGAADRDRGGRRRRAHDLHRLHDAARRAARARRFDDLSDRRQHRAQPGAHEDRRRAVRRRRSSSRRPPVSRRLWIMSGLVLLMAVFANIVSNTSAAVIGTPIAVSIANLLGVAPEPFVLAVLFGVNLGFCTPMADNCNLLVLNAGGYRSWISCAWACR